MAKKKVNPNRRPVSEALIKKVSREVGFSARRYVMALTLIVLKDKFLASQEHIADFIEAYNTYDRAVGKGEIKLADIKDTLKQEYGIELHDEFDAVDMEKE